MYQSYEHWTGCHQLVTSYDSRPIGSLVIQHFPTYLRLDPQGAEGESGAKDEGSTQKGLTEPGVPLNYRVPNTTEITWKSRPELWI